MARAKQRNFIGLKTYIESIWALPQNKSVILDTGFDKSNEQAMVFDSDRLPDGEDLKPVKE